MEKNLFTCNSERRYPVACFLAVATVLAALIFLLNSPEKTRSAIKSWAYEGNRVFYIKGRLRELAETKDLSKIVFILGDSLTQVFEEELEVDKSVEQLVKNEAIRFVCLNRPAFTMVDYFCIVNAIAPLKPKAIIVCINLATFSPIYENNAAYKFPEMLALCSPESFERYGATLSRFYGLSIKEMKAYTESEKDSAFHDMILGLRNMTRGWITENIEAKILGRRMREEVSNSKKQAQLFSNTYRIPHESLPEAHPYFVLAKAISEIGKKENIKIIFYITPIDMEFAKKAGIVNEIEPSIMYIKDSFRKILSQEDAHLYDLHDSLSESDIVDTPGHLRESGRKKIYAFLSDILTKP